MDKHEFGPGKIDSEAYNNSVSLSAPFIECQNPDAEIPSSLIYVETLDSHRYRSSLKPLWSFDGETKQAERSHCQACESQCDKYDTHVTRDICFLVAATDDLALVRPSSFSFPHPPFSLILCDNNLWILTYWYYHMRFCKYLSINPFSVPSLSCNESKYRIIDTILPVRHLLFVSGDSPVLTRIQQLLLFLLLTESHVGWTPTSEAISQWSMG